MEDIEKTPSPQANTIAAAEQKERHDLANLIKARLLNVHPDDQDLELEDEDWTRICAALTEDRK